VNDLVRILARALALDVQQYPDGPPAEVSATSPPRTSRLTTASIVSGRLYPGPRAYDCAPMLRLAGRAGGAA
jgi:hypothetical protein